jgi:hypothetical protein
LLPLYGKNGGRFLRYARSCLARSGRNDGGVGDAMRGGAGREPPVRHPLPPPIAAAPPSSFRAERGTSHLTTKPLLPLIRQKWREVPPLRALVPRALRSE